MNINRSTTTVDVAGMLGIEQAREASCLEFIRALLESGNLANTVSWMSRTMSELEREQTLIQAMRENRLVDLYESAAERRFEATRLGRIACLGLNGNRSAGKAAEGALEEMKAVKRELEATSQNQMLAGVANRLRFLQILAQTGEQGARMALQLMEELLPNEAYQRVLRLAAQAGGDER